MSILVAHNIDSNILNFRHLCVIYVLLIFKIKFQVQFDRVYRITGIATQGRPPGGGQYVNQYVISYKLRYSSDCSTFYTYSTANGTSVYVISLLFI